MCKLRKVITSAGQKKGMPLLENEISKGKTYYISGYFLEKMSLVET